MSKADQPERLYRVRFVQQDQMFEVYARNVLQGELYGFVTIEEFVFDTRDGVVVDPGEEKLKTEFAGVKRSIVPMHAIVRIDEVERRGTAKIYALPSQRPAVPPPPTPLPRPGS